MAELAFANPSLAPIIPIVEGVVAVGLMGALVYYMGAQMVATQTGMLLNAKLAVARFLQQMVVQTALMVATATSMAMMDEIINLEEYKRNRVKELEAIMYELSMTGEVPPPGLPPGKDFFEWLNGIMEEWSKLTGNPWPPTPPTQPPTFPRLGSG